MIRRVYVTVEGIRDLLVGDEPSISVVGMVLTGLSAVVMPTLARLKRSAGRGVNSRLVIADAAETKLCAWLSVSPSPASPPSVVSRSVTVMIPARLRNDRLSLQGVDQAVDHVEGVRVQR